VADQLEAAVTCPYCGEPIVILVDPSVTQQAYVEDCEVCCQPMAVRAEVDPDGIAQIDVRREDDW
jgi:transcription elongation factor Elf1